MNDEIGKRNDAPVSALTRVDDSIVQAFDVVLRSADFTRLRALLSRAKAAVDTNVSCKSTEPD